jgi:hypothetical protein
MRIEISEKDWAAIGRKLYGDDRRDWKFKCPVCGNVATARDYEMAGASEGTVGFSCLGRWTGATSSFNGSAPCNYAGGGLIRLNPIFILTESGHKHNLFDFGCSELERNAS